MQLQLKVSKESKNSFKKRHQEINQMQMQTTFK
jgi:hypothetical protein